MNFTYQNHLKYFIDNRLYGYRTTGIEKYTVSVGSVDIDYYRKSNYLNELRRIADLVYSDFGSDFVLFLSGGTDSEIVLRSFLSIGIKPRCYTIKFIDDYNHVDVKDAIELCKQLDVDLNLVDFDVKNFYYSGLASEFGKELQCTQITYLIIYYNILKINTPAIMGGELLLKRNINTQPSTWYYCLRENEDGSAMRFSLKHGIPLINEWFSYTPEIMLYYLENKDIKQLVSDKFNYKLTSVSSKNTILKHLVPDVIAKRKSTGFEKLFAFNHEVYRLMLNQQILRLEPSLDGIEYNQCVHMLKASDERN